MGGAPSPSSAPRNEGEGAVAAVVGADELEASEGAENGAGPVKGGSCSGSGSKGQEEQSLPGSGPPTAPAAVDHNQRRRRRTDAAAALAAAALPLSCPPSAAVGTGAGGGGKHGLVGSIAHTGLGPLPLLDANLDDLGGAWMVTVTGDGRIAPCSAAVAGQESEAG